MSKAEILTFAATQPQQIKTPDGRVISIKSKSKDNALSVAAFYSGVRFIAETLSTLPKHVYQKQERGRKKVDHTVTPLMSEYPNEATNAAYLWETAIGHAVMYGNGYVYIERKGGRVSALHNLHALRVYPTLQGSKMFYGVYMDNNKDPLILESSNVIHIRNFSEDGERGLSVIDTLCDTLGMPRKVDTLIDKFFDNGSAVNLVIESAGKLDKADVDTLRYGIDNNHKGIDNAHKTMILSGATAKNLTLPLKDMALDVLKASSIDDVSRVLRIPPTTLYALGRATWGNLEQLGTELVKYSFTPWIVKIELECKRKLLSDRERASGMYVKWNLDGLQRGDYATRVEAGVKLTSNRLMTPNEWREMEDLEPYDGGDEFYGPLNTPAIGQDATDNADLGSETPDETAPPPGESGSDVPPETTPEPQDYRKTYGLILDDVAQRVKVKQVKAFANHANKQGAELENWVERFAFEHGAFLAESLTPFFSSVIEDADALAFAKETAAKEYAAQIKADGDKSEPRLVINSILERIG